MVEVRWTSQTLEDIESIAGFIARNSASYARLFVLDVYQAVERLERFPLSGRIVPELRIAAIREIILGNYRRVYRYKRGLVEMLTVHHASRLLASSRLPRA